MRTTVRSGYACVNLSQGVENNSQYPNLNLHLRGKYLGRVVQITQSTAEALSKIQDAHILMQEKYMPMGPATQAIPIYQQRGNTLHIYHDHLMQLPMKTEGDIAYAGIKYGTGCCSHYGHLSLGLLQQQIVDRPLLLTSDTHRDHQYILAGDFRDPRWGLTNTGVGDGFQVFPIAFTLSEGEGYFPSSADVASSYYCSRTTGLDNYQPRPSDIEVDFSAFDPDHVVKEYPQPKLEDPLPLILNEPGVWHSLVGSKGIDTTYMTPDGRAHHYDDVTRGHLSNTERTLGEMAADGMDKSVLDEIEKRPHLPQDSEDEDDF